MNELWDCVKQVKKMNEYNRDYINCDVCHNPIYRADDLYDGDDYYELDELNICTDCIHEYTWQHRKELR